MEVLDDVYEKTVELDGTLSIGVKMEDCRCPMLIEETSGPFGKLGWGKAFAERYAIVTLEHWHWHWHHN